MEGQPILARYQTQRDDQSCRCELCPRHCVIKPEASGFCLHRYNQDGQLFAAQYGEVAALAIDPIEKKPLYHFHPGSDIVSVGANGCNLACKFCQNWHLSCGHAQTRPLSPEELAATADRQGSIGIAFTYNEPLIWFEYILDTAALLKPRNLAVVLVTNGYLETEPFDELLPWIDAMNIDVKGDDRFYRELTGGRLAPVRRNVEAAHRAGVHVEVTNLLITGENDDEASVRDLVDWLASVSPDIPLHFSRYFPQHKFHAPQTPVASLERAAAIAREKLNFVFLGNVQLAHGSDTVCPHCGQTVIDRRGYLTNRRQLQPGGKCGHCGAQLKIID
ncbi:MAG TPA: AmmeMemoRadiSam system radical SAM enzyme [bacterium]|nr:AmmeMemoRadiSam system radical SAM enzyme [bacterium]